MKIKNTLVLYVVLFLVGVLPRAGAATVIDIMLVYDSTAKAWVDNNGGMALFSAQAVARMNQSMENSGIDGQFRLVYSGEVDYTHEALGADLSNIRSGSGNLSVVHEWRNTHAADVVAFLLDTGSAFGHTGSGYLLSNAGGSPNFAYSSNAIRAVQNGYTLVHEVGHNLGAHHAKNQRSDPGPNSALNSYSAGWYFTGSNGTAYHTIMAYSHDGYGNVYQIAPLFSTPLLSWQGTVAGHPADGDNSRTIRETMGVVAAYRAAVELTPPNDNFANAIVLTGATGQVTGTNVEATREPGEPFHWSTTGGQSVWWRWTAPVSGEVVIDTFGSNFDTILAVYTGSAVDSLTLVAANDDHGGLQSRVSFAASAGVTYHMAVDGFGSHSGAIVLNWSQAVREIQLSGDLSFDEVIVGTTGTRTLFVENTGNSPLTISSLQFSIAALSSPWTGPETIPPGEEIPIEITFSPAVTGPHAGTIQVNSDANAGVPVRSASGFGIPDPVPANDDFAQALLLTGTSGQATGSNIEATMEPGEPFHWSTTGGRSVWWRWTAPADGQMVIDTFGSNFDTILAVYTGNAVSTLTLVAANDDHAGLQSEVIFAVSAGETYRIAVDGFGSASGEIVLNWSFVESDPVESDAPDFFIAVIHLDDRSPHVGQTVNARVVVRNRGSSAGDGGFLDVWLDLPEAPTVEDVIGGGWSEHFFEVGSLAPGEEATYAFSFVAAGEGPKVLRAFVDSENQTAESSEENNQTTLDYAVHASPMRSLVAWAREHGLPEGKRGLQDVAGPLPLTNTQAYALGLNPLLATAADVPHLVPSPDPTELRLRYKENFRRMGVSTWFEESGDLHAWTAGTPVSDTTVGTHPGGLIREARFNTGGSAENFLRMGADLPGWILRGAFPSFGNSVGAAVGAEDRMRVYAGVNGAFSHLGSSPIRMIEMNGDHEILREFTLMPGLVPLVRSLVLDEGREQLVLVDDNMHNIISLISLSDGLFSSFSTALAAHSVAVSRHSELIYVTGTTRGHGIGASPRTRAFHRNGTVAFDWVYGTGHPGLLVDPRGIVADENGDVLIWDDGFLKRFTAEGVFLEARAVDVPIDGHFGLHSFGQGWLVRTSQHLGTLITRTGEVVETGVPWGRYQSGLLYTPLGVYERNPFAPPLEID